MVKVTRKLLLVAKVAKKIAEQRVADATWAILLIEILHWKSWISDRYRASGPFTFSPDHNLGQFLCLTRNTPFPRSKIRHF